MASKVSVTAASTVDYEISGGSEGTFAASTKEFTIGVQGGMIQFLTLIRASPGNIVVKALDANIVVEQSGKSKSVSRGKTLKLSSSTKRALVKEAVK